MNDNCYGIKRNCCPKCGCAIEVSWLYQYSHAYIIGKRGKVLNKYRTRDLGSMEVAIANCTNYKECDVRWESDDFIIDGSDHFIDLKYTEEYDNI